MLKAICWGRDIRTWGRASDLHQGQMGLGKICQENNCRSKTGERRKAFVLWHSIASMALPVSSLMECPKAARILMSSPFWRFIYDNKWAWVWTSFRPCAWKSARPAWPPPHVQTVKDGWRYARESGNPKEQNVIHNPSPVTLWQCQCPSLTLNRQILSILSLFWSSQFAKQHAALYSEPFRTQIVTVSSPHILLETTRKAKTIPIQASSTERMNCKRLDHLLVFRTGLNHLNRSEPNLESTGNPNVSILPRQPGCPAAKAAGNVVENILGSLGRPFCFTVGRAQTQPTKRQLLKHSKFWDH